MLSASHSEDARSVGFCIHYGCHRLFQRGGSWRCLYRWRVNPLAERQEKPHHEPESLLQRLAQLAVRGCQTNFLGQLAIEFLSAFCTLTEGLTSTWVSVSLAMM